MEELLQAERLCQSTDGPVEPDGHILRSREVFLVRHLLFTFPAGAVPSGLLRPYSESPRDYHPLRRKLRLFGPRGVRMQEQKQKRQSGRQLSQDCSCLEAAAAACRPVGAAPHLTKRGSGAARRRVCGARRREVVGFVRSVCRQLWNRRAPELWHPFSCELACQNTGQPEVRGRGVLSVPGTPAQHPPNFTCGRQHQHGQRRSGRTRHSRGPDPPGIQATPTAPVLHGFRRSSDVTALYRTDAAAAFRAPHDV